MNHTLHRLSQIICLLTLSSQAFSALSVDRTRIIYNGNTAATAIMISNQDDSPYVMQSWMEDENGQRITEPLVALLLLQRIDPKQKKQVRITTIGNKQSLPNDKESLFYYNVLEVPPKSQTTENVLQVAIQSRLKVFYRPAAIINKKESTWQKQIEVSKNADSLILNNQSPYYVIINGLDDGSKASKQEIKELILKPKDKATHRLNNKIANQFKMTYINDYGGLSSLSYECQQSSCTLQTTEEGQ